MQNKEDKYYLKAELLLLVSALIWGISFPTVKVAMVYVSPFLFVFLRFFITIILFSAIFFNKIKKLTFRDISYGAILGIYLYLGFIFQTLGLKYTTASNSAFITGFCLVLIPFAQFFIIRKAPKIENIIGIVVSIFGLYFLSGFGNSTGFNKGDVFTIFCALAFTFQIVFLDVYSKKTDYIAIIFGQFLAMLILSFFSTVIFELIITKSLKFEANFTSIGSILFNAVFSALIALYISNRFQKYTTPVKAGIIYNMEQVFAVIFAYFMIGEVLSKHQLIGAVVMLFGLMISEFYKEIKSIFSNIFANR